MFKYAGTHTHSRNRAKPSFLDWVHEGLVSDDDGGHDIKFSCSKLADNRALTVYYCVDAVAKMWLSDPSILMLLSTTVCSVILL